MIDVLNFFFNNIWHFIGLCVVLLIITGWRFKE